MQSVARVAMATATTGFYPMKLTPTHIQSARRHLRAADPVMKAIIDAVGPYTLRFERDRFGHARAVHHFPADFDQCGPCHPQAVAGTCWAGGLTAANLARFTRRTAVGRFVAAEGVLCGRPWRAR